MMKRLMRVPIFSWVVLPLTLAGMANNSFCQTGRVAFFRKQFYGSSSLRDKLGAALAMCAESHSISPDSLYYYSCFAKTASAKLNDLPAGVLANVFTEVFLSRKNLFDSALARCRPSIDASSPARGRGQQRASRRTSWRARFRNGRGA